MLLLRGCTRKIQKIYKRKKENKQNSRKPGSLIPTSILTCLLSHIHSFDFTTWFQTRNKLNKETVLRDLCSGPSQVAHAVPHKNLNPNMVVQLNPNSSRSAKPTIPYQSIHHNQSKQPAWFTDPLIVRRHMRPWANVGAVVPVHPREDNNCSHYDNHNVSWTVVEITMGARQGANSFNKRLQKP